MKICYNVRVNADGLKRERKGIMAKQRGCFIKKNLIYILLVLIISCVAFTACLDFNNQKPSEGLEFQLSSDGTYYILIGRGTCEDTRIVVPAKYEGKPVEVIAYESHIELFGDEILEEIVIPEGVKKISPKAFHLCYSLKTVHIPKSLEEIGNRAFAYAPIENIYLKDLKSWLNASGYIYCSDRTNYYINGRLLTDLRIPNGIVEIKERAFYGCMNIETVSMPSSVKNIGDNAFAHCGYLKSVQFSDTLETIGQGAFYVCGDIEELVLPDSLKTIEPYAFGDNTSLTRLALGSGIETIGENAFSSCFALFEIFDKSNLKLEMGTESHGKIAYNAKLITDNSSETRLKNISDYIFYIDGDEAYLLTYRGNSKNLVLPNISMNYKVNDGAFSEGHWDCPNVGIESVYIPQFVTEIGDYAFLCCWNLKQVTVSSGVSKIGDYAFFRCNSLSSINYNGTVKQWNAIYKEKNWCPSVHSATIICTDGTITLD